MSEGQDDASEESTTESVCSRSSRRSSNDTRVVTDGVLQEMGIYHRNLEQLVVQNKGEFRTPARAIESTSVQDGAASAEPNRAVSFSEPAKDYESATTDSDASRRGQGSRPKLRSLGVYLSRFRLSRRPSSTRKGVKTMRKNRTKKKQTSDASPSSSNRRMRSTLGQSLGSFGFIVLIVAGVVLLFAYAVVFLSGRLVRRPESLEARPINRTEGSG
ncbi:uncharacterized protein LOC125939891 [Dermacentor silvarum]|uniref:uncharacterized protein LOC125939891 n=1 Tax=Dermacentor silvarum TaxID=543639 RepID=UPI0021019780|nr:uncharacterized protein LOC125939891 [Dermacentor silvarum]